MNVSEAKEEIKRTIRMYLDKDEEGEYIVPCRERRPIYLEGAPGIGKRAVIEQAAAELEVALAVCSMAHHTRQSAMGHVCSVKKEYEGKIWLVSEYAMGEIMGAVYETMEESGEKEGILFLEEVGSASEPLMPAVLQLLQHRTLGGKRLPEGWMVAAADSLPGHKGAGRKFGSAVLDRMNCFRIEADFSVWKTYAYKQLVHGAVIAFLEINRDCFSFTDAEADGGEYATPRGWQALSSAMRSYEKKGFPVDKGLVLQYIASREVAERFLAHYGMFLRQREKYSAEDLLEGENWQRILEDAARMGRSERITFSVLLREKCNYHFVDAQEQGTVLGKMEPLLRDAEEEAAREGLPLYLVLSILQERLRERRRRRRAANNLDGVWGEAYRKIDALLGSYAEAVKRENGLEQGTAYLKRECAVLEQRYEESMRKGREMLGRAAAFAEEAWGDGGEKALLLENWHPAQEKRRRTVSPEPDTI